MKFSKDEDKMLLISYGSFFGGAVNIEFIKVDETFCKCIIVGSNGYPVDSEFMVSRTDLNRLDQTIKKICRWNDYYPDTDGILDGFGWEIEIHMGDIDIRKHGYEAFPRNYNEVMQELIMFVDEFFKKSVPEGEYRLPLNPFMYTIIKFGQKIETWDESEEIYPEVKKHKTQKSQVSSEGLKTLQIPDFLKKE